MRISLISFFVVLIAFSTTVHSAETTVVSPDQLRELIYDGDINALETELADAQALLEAGSISEDEVRALFAVFGVTHPDVISLTRGWLKARPNSPFAHIAMAWILNKAGWIVRGTKYARDTHPDAMRSHNVLHSEALSHAITAYEMNPKMIAASDAIIMMANTGGNKPLSFEVFHMTMQDTPNWGTLSRAFVFGHPGYGGSIELGMSICEEYAPLVDIGKRDATSDCKIQFLVELRNFQNWPSLALVYIDQQESSPWLDRYRFLANLNNHPIDRSTAEWLRDYVSVHGVASLHWADYYDMNVANLWGFELQAEITLETEKERARAALEHDPYNPALLDILMRRSHIVTRSVSKNGETTSVQHNYTPIKDSPSEEATLEYLQRKVTVAPYDPESWKKLGWLLRIHSVGASRQGADLIRWDGYLQNSVYYGMHKLSYLENFVTEKVFQLAQLNEILAMEEGTIEESAIEEGAFGWAEAIENIDRNADLVCPIVRLGILMNLVRANNGLQSNLDPETQATIVRLTEDVSVSDACGGLLQADPSELLFGPVPLDVLGQRSPYDERSYSPD